MGILFGKEFPCCGPEVCECVQACLIGEGDKEGVFFFAKAHLLSGSVCVRGSGIRDSSVR